jgi:hypothetical protein
MARYLVLLPLPGRNVLIGRSGCASRTEAALLAMDELAMHFASKRVYDGYLKFLVVSEAAITNVLRKLFAMDDCFSVSLLRFRRCLRLVQSARRMRTERAVVRRQKNGTPFGLVSNGM